MLDRNRIIELSKEVQEAQAQVVAVELERAHPRGVGAEREYENIAHQPHVLVDALRQPVGGAGPVGLGERGAPPLQAPLPPGVVDAPLDLTHRGEVLVQPARVGPAHPGGVGAHRVEYALVRPARLVAEQPVERERGVQLQRHRRRRRGPRDVRAVDHRVVLVQGRDRRLAPEHQARHLGLAPQPVGEHLVHTHARANFSTAGQVRPGEQVSRLAAAADGVVVLEREAEGVDAPVARRARPLGAVPTERRGRARRPPARGRRQLPGRPGRGRTLLIESSRRRGLAEIANRPALRCNRTERSARQAGLQRGEFAGRLR